MDERLIPAGVNECVTVEEAKIALESLQRELEELVKPPTKKRPNSDIKSRKPEVSELLQRVLGTRKAALQEWSGKPEELAEAANGIMASAKTIDERSTGKTKEDRARLLTQGLGSKERIERICQVLLRAGGDKKDTRVKVVDKLGNLMKLPEEIAVTMAEESERIYEELVEAGKGTKNTDGKNRALRSIAAAVRLADVTSPYVFPPLPRRQLQDEDSRLDSGMTS